MSDLSGSETLGIVDGCSVGFDGETDEVDCIASGSVKVSCGDNEDRN